jgi:hypothetical protein
VDRSRFPPHLQANSLISKKFSVPLSLEVGRIIRGFEKASTAFLKKLNLPPG